MKKQGEFDLNAECNFSGLKETEEIETACKYEYMRESQALRDEIENLGTDWNREYKVFNHSGAILASRPRPILPLFAHENLRASERYHLVYDALWKAGFPKPWKQLDQHAKLELIKRITGWKENRKKSHPPVVIEAASPELDEELNYDPGKSHARLYWRLKPSEPQLLRGCEQSGRKYFFGFIRIDEAYNQTEACDAFKTWFEERYGQRKKGNPHFDGKLRQLAAMRVRHHYPRGDREGILLEMTGKKTYKTGRDKIGSCTDKADIGLSRDCEQAKTFFQTLFPGEEPIRFPVYKP
jgi:hypothetical protein